MIRATVVKAPFYDPENRRQSRDCGIRESLMTQLIQRRSPVHDVLEELASEMGSGSGYARGILV